MITNFFGRSAALLSVAFFLATSSTVIGQTVSALSTSRIESLSTAGEAGVLRNHLLVALKGKIEKTNVAETVTISGSGKTVTADIIAILIGLKSEKVELVSIRLTEGAKITQFNLVQYADGRLSELQGNDLVAYSTTKEIEACAGGSEARCSGCSAGGNAAVARSAGVAQKVSNFFKATNAACLGCYGDIDDVIACITGHRR